MRESDSHSVASFFPSPADSFFPLSSRPSPTTTSLRSSPNHLSPHSYNSLSSASSPKPSPNTSPPSLPFSTHTPTTAPSPLSFIPKTGTPRVFASSPTGLLYEPRTSSRRSVTVQSLHGDRKEDVQIGSRRDVITKGWKGGRGRATLRFRTMERGRRSSSMAVTSTSITTRRWG